MKKIVLTGGGTLGPVTPLLAIAEAVRDGDDMKVVGFVGTKGGPERILVEKLGLPFFAIFAGKWRRYLSWQNLLGPFRTVIGIAQSWRLLGKLKPTVVVSGGGFIGVPVVIAAWLRRIPAITHQQDIKASLANKIVTPFVKRITVTFDQTLDAFPKNKIVLTGNPIRPSILRGRRDQAIRKFNLDPNMPIVFVFGGGTGADGLNKLVLEAVPELTKFCQIIHGTGRGKIRMMVHELGMGDRYRPIELLENEMADAYAAADVVMGRAGIGTITELSALGKPAIIMPMPGTHQEANADTLLKKDAAVVVSQLDLTSENFVEIVRDLLENKERREALGVNIRAINSPDALENVLSVIREVQ